VSLNLPHSAECCTGWVTEQGVPPCCSPQTIYKAPECTQWDRPLIFAKWQPKPPLLSVTPSGGMYTLG